MDPVSMLLFNALVRHQSINLPEIGSLSVQHTPARLQGTRLLTPPANRVVFSPNSAEQAVSILTLIERSSGKQTERCNAIYQSWLESVRSEGQVRIPTVGMIAEERFRPTEELNRIMNPFPATAQKLKRRGQKNGLVWGALGAVVVGLALTAGYLLYTGRAEAESRSAELNQAKQTLQSTTAQSPAPEAQNTATTATAAGQTAPTPTGGATPASTSPATASSASTTSANSTSAAAASADNTPVATAVNTSSTHYYVIVGLYSTAENANRCIAQARAENTKLHYGTLPQRSGRLLVYIADEPTAEQAEAIRQAHLGTFPESWILKRP